jgi:hypothetical protein
MRMTAFYRFAKAGSAALALALSLAGCKGPWSKEFKQEQKGPNISRPALNPIPPLNLSANGGPKTVNVTLTDPDSKLTCHEAISTHSSDITVVPATYMEVSGTAPNCQVKITPAPGVVGTSEITLTVTDGQNISSTSFLVNSYGVPSANATPVPTAIVNRAYAGFTVSGTGGLAPYTYSLASGSLPSGMTINSSTGAVSGTPTAYGKFSNIVFRVTDSDNGTATTAPFDLYVASYYSDLTAGTTIDAAMTFARNSAGTRIGASGLLQTVSPNTPRFEWDPLTAAAKGVLVEEGRSNLLTLSEHFETPFGWATQQASVAADAAAAPDGTTTADFLKEDNTANSVHTVRVASVAKDNASRNYAFSVFAKANGRSALTLRVGNDAFSAYAQATCTFSGAGSVSASASGFTSPAGRIQALANGWYRCSISAASDTSLTIRPEIRLHNGTSETYTGNNTAGVYLWGAQLEEGRLPSSYIPAHSLLNYGEDIVTARGWTINNTNQVAIFPDDTAAPDGSNTAERVADTTNSTEANVYRDFTISTAAASYTVSIYVKKNASSVIALTAQTSGGFNFSSSRGLAFDTVAGNYTAMQGYTAPGAVRVENAGGYWRVAFAVPSNANNDTLTFSLYPAWAATLNGTGLGSTTNGQNNLQSSAYFWGAQILAGALPAALPVYFQRTSETVRAPDLLDVPTVPAGAFNPAEGTMVAAVNFEATPAGTAAVACFSDGTATNRLTQSFTSTQAILSLVAGAYAQTPATKAQVPLGIMKIASAYKANDLAIAVNGTMGGTSAQATIPTVNRLRLGRAEGDTSFLNGHLRSILYFGNRLPNTLLPNLSL